MRSELASVDSCILAFLANFAYSKIYFCFFLHMLAIL